MRNFQITIIMMFLGLATASAATVDLNDGRVVQGDIVKQDDNGVQVNVDGVSITYYKDEIKDIDGKPFGAATADQAAAAPTPAAEPAAQPEAAAQTAPAQPEAATDVTSAVQSSPETGSIDPEKRALILKFIDVFGTRQALSNNFDLMLQQIEKEKPDEAQRIRQRVKVDEIIERLLPIYDRNFTSDDLKAFIAFYGSSEGRKLIGTIPELMKESVQESVKYMEEKFPELKQGQQ